MAFIFDENIENCICQLWFFDDIVNKLLLGKDFSVIFCFFIETLKFTDQLGMSEEINTLSFQFSEEFFGIFEKGNRLQDSL